MLQSVLLRFRFPPQCRPHLPRDATHPLAQNLLRNVDAVLPDSLVPNAEGLSDHAPSSVSSSLTRSLSD
jgi:hypothetical protein